jgi:ribosome biogenesis protein UTP30
MTKGRFEASTIEHSIDALLQFEQKIAAGRNVCDLLVSAGEKVLVQITLKRVPGKSSPKPLRIVVPHPILDEETDMCLFLKKEDKPKIKEILMEDSATKVPSVKKIITLDKLRTSYKQYAQKRELLSTYDLFLADDRILPMLTTALGKTFLSRKKQPIPVNVTRRSSLPAAIRKARISTYMVLSTGTCVSVCVGTTAMRPEEIARNVAACVPAAVAHIPRKWKNVQAVHLKTTNSTALPIFNKLPFLLAANGDSVDDEVGGDRGGTEVMSASATALSKNRCEEGFEGPSKSTMAAMSKAARIVAGHRSDPCRIVKSKKRRRVRAGSNSAKASRFY